MKIITVKLPESLAAWLSHRARELGRPQSQLVRDALQKEKDGTAGPSCHEAMTDVCGVVEGPKDLSTHSKHLAGFGESVRSSSTRGHW